METTTDYATKRLGLYQTFAEHSYEGMLITDAAGVILQVNQKYEAISGLSKQELIGKNIQQLVDDGILSASATAEAIRIGKPVSMAQVFSSNVEAYANSTPIFDDNEQLLGVVTCIMDMRDLNGMLDNLKGVEHRNSRHYKELTKLKTAIFSDNEIVAVDSKTISIYHAAQRVAATDELVFLHGPRGIGKENVARYIHRHSARAEKPFLHIYSSMLLSPDAERKLFGYTDEAEHYHPGILEENNGGTAYIGELQDVSIALQVKLLELIHTGALVTACGRRKHVNVRFVIGSVLTEAELDKCPNIAREWYFVLSAFSINLPPLKEKRNDIVPLLNYFLNDYNQRYHLEKRFEKSAYTRLMMYDWPGNIREMKIMVHRAVIMSDNQYIKLQDLFMDSSMQQTADALNELPDHFDLKMELEKIEADYIVQSYAKYKNVRTAAKSLEMDSSTFVRKRQVYQRKGYIKPPEQEEAE
ncbi:MAG: sigma 54-interacting transcriptional regulator [Oscillospiraceae bacterium]|nr:sigma 54-interacting transcriptional regulator [Oscillospiraceae bacterium]